MVIIMVLKPDLRADSGKEPCHGLRGLTRVNPNLIFFLKKLKQHYIN
jgi:hypothetical protein